MESRPEYGMQVAFDLAEQAIFLRAERYRREHPDADETEVEAFIAAWWLERPGAPDGDSVGRPIPVARFNA